MKAPGRRQMSIKRKGPKRLVVTTSADIAGNTMTVTFDYNHRNAPTELLDLFEVQFGEAQQELINRQENVTAGEALDFIVDGLQRYVDTTKDNMANVFVEE